MTTIRLPLPPASKKHPVQYSKAGPSATTWVTTSDNMLDGWLNIDLEKQRQYLYSFSESSNAYQAKDRLTSLLHHPQEALSDFDNRFKHLPDYAKQRQELVNLMNYWTFPNISSHVPALSAGIALGLGRRDSQQDSADIDSMLVDEKAVPSTEPAWKLFLESIFKKLSDRLREDPELKSSAIHSGASAVTAIIHQNTCIAAIAGDGLLHQVVEGEEGTIRCTNESRDIRHNAENPAELKRIAGLGVTLARDRTPGGLNVFRGLGDFEDKAITHVPDVKILPTPERIKRRWLVLSSDGAVELTPNDIAHVFQQHQNASSEVIARALLALTQSSYAKNVGDNVSFIVVEVTNNNPEEMIIAANFDGHGWCGNDIARFCANTFASTIKQILSPLSKKPAVVSPSSPALQTDVPSSAPATISNQPERKEKNDVIPRNQSYIPATNESVARLRNELQTKQQEIKASGQLQMAELLQGVIEIMDDLTKERQATLNKKMMIAHEVLLSISDFLRSGKPSACMYEELAKDWLSGESNPVYRAFNRVEGFFRFHFPLDGRDVSKAVEKLQKKIDYISKNLERDSKLNNPDLSSSAQLGHGTRR